MATFQAVTMHIARITRIAMHLHSICIDCDYMGLAAVLKRPRGPVRIWTSSS